ncbi:DNA polymerase-3 subunit epsilon [Aquimarina sp. MAR_2010_214]|uniref:3'-5' exonuclease n=1 Tax=Aquimarina sp. MAR_2010_214 TaxID=1250026 RepID=UPI000C6FD4FC|nr:3'-5' exonuclease [Aquimarina sp. MAR_2010_214]PKV51712.1 DNA polymerase-3 subunit epsilon [Aquimarina sp. MAR_2010_214]
MLRWFRHKQYPDYWNRYLQHFNTKKDRTLATTRFVVFDTETTGLDITNDKILSIGAIAVTGNTMDVADSFEVYLQQETFNPETVEIHGILKSGHITKVKESEAIAHFLDYIKDAILVAHHADFDVAMINKCLARLQLPKLKNKTLDTGVLFKKTELCKATHKHYGLDELSAIFNIAKHDRHTSSGDAFITGLLFLKIIASLTKKRKVTLKDLFFNPNRRGLL